MSPILELGVIAFGLYVAGWLSRKVGLSSIVGYILLGLLLGPYGVYTLYETTPITAMLGELGIIMLLFYMGLEFSLGRFFEGRPRDYPFRDARPAQFRRGRRYRVFAGDGLVGGALFGRELFISRARASSPNS